MEKNLDPNSWVVKGRCFKPGTDDNCIDGDITITEEVSNLRMGPRSRVVAPTSATAEELEPFGMPVDANLAIDLIKNAVSLTKPLADQFSQKGYSKLTEEEKSIYELLNLSYGVTFDKTLILKILSQPNCAGLRSYICARKSPDKAVNKLHVSLVMVGVDIAGYDLSYDIVNLIDKDVSTVSLIAEYGYPPDEKKKHNWTGKSKKIDKHYTLLRHAVKKGEEEIKAGKEIC